LGRDFVGWGWALREWRSRRALDLAFGGGGGGGAAYKTVGTGNGMRSSGRGKKEEGNYWHAVTLLLSTPALL
jgi:hypothetical protein